MSSGAGTSSATSSPPCPSPPTPARRPRWPRSTTPRTRTTPWPRRGTSRPTTAPSGPRASPRSSNDLDELLPFTTPRRALDPPPNHQPDRVDVRHRPASASSHRGPRLQGRRHRDGVQADRAPSTAGARSTHSTSSPSTAPARVQERQTRRRARRIKEVTLTPRDKPIPRS